MFLLKNTVADAFGVHLSQHFSLTDVKLPALCSRKFSGAETTFLPMSQAGSTRELKSPGNRLQLAPHLVGGCP